MVAPLTSHEPATGALLWQGETGDVDAEVARARAAWPKWAAQPIAYRIEVTGYCADCQSRAGAPQPEGENR